jgi:phosphoglycerate dehydrogenase-like enzyme
VELSRPPLVVTFELSEKRKAIVADALAGASAVVYLAELDEAARAEALRNTGALLTFNTSKELRPGEAELLDGARLIQFMIAGVDFIPLGELPEGVPVATNGGGYAESMAEHALAMALAAAKRLILEHENLKRGQFNQFTQNRMLAGGVCGIFGFGGIGAATARLMHGIGMRVHANNRHGRTDERVDWSGTPERLNELLEAADVLLISAPLTRATYAGRAPSVSFTAPGPVSCTREISARSQRGRREELRGCLGRCPAPAVPLSALLSSSAPG